MHKENSIISMGGGQGGFSIHLANAAGNLMGLRRIRG